MTETQTEHKVREQLMQMNTQEEKGMIRKEGASRGREQQATEC